MKAWGCRRPWHSVPSQSGEFALLVTALHMWGCGKRIGDVMAMQWLITGG